MERISETAFQKATEVRARQASKMRCEKARKRATEPDAMPTGTAPYGYLVAPDTERKYYIPDPDTAPYVRMMFKWEAHTVIKILQNPNYTGNIYMGRLQQALYKAQLRRKTAAQEWGIRENTHEPLVTKEDFEEVQRQIAKNRKK